MRRIFLTGDSHTAALQRGQKTIEAEGLWPATIDLTIRPLGVGNLTRAPFFVDRGDHADITTPEYRRFLQRLPLDGPGEARTIYAVSAPLHSVRIWRHRDWRRHLPIDLWRLGATIGAEKASDGDRAEAPVPVSSGLLRRIVEEDQKYMFELIALLLRNGFRVFVVEAPHPFRHHSALRHTPAEVVLHLDRVYRHIVGARLEAMGVPVVRVPEYCLDGGFTREDYAQPRDEHHGNGRYGRIMMQEILAFLERALPD